MKFHLNKIQQTVLCFCTCNIIGIPCERETWVADIGEADVEDASVETIGVIDSQLISWNVIDQGSVANQRGDPTGTAEMHLDNGLNVVEEMNYHRSQDDRIHYCEGFHRISRNMSGEICFSNFYRRT